ncbi:MULTISPECIES: nitroreductase family protein [Sphingobium]|uniref:NAD(P)H-flavin oxidoreductase n=2 Tax=Sphingobium cupriresistens TaxID=1132417 RepID=A0A0J8AIS7_9SPHN|nr:MULTISPECIES: nitroreductase family protein [Sphingobium]KMS54635.1 NAD(P)H-flavin oxidoreductase [Sphingobium cupriresistens LL01]MBJ7376537.1 nitroreductase family protein [Sphingobium sp.]RYM12892.1 nitroreductase [Sphingobium cupriresistens]WCP13059.1 malonic semialdehyde reductase RutE [Sphingobium sp. AntQ-1]
MATNPRAVTRAVDSLFLERWSPRAFDSSAIAQDDLDTIFDAARWAPSAFNYQPWRFLYAHRDSADWSRFLRLLLPFNQAWVQNAGAIVFILSDTLMAAPGSEDYKPSHSHSFDAGAAWALLALQATRLGYHTHGMTGVDFDKARAELAVPERFRIEAAVAIGRQGDKAVLPEALQAREEPSDRKPIEAFAHSGNFAG